MDSERRIAVLEYLEDGRWPNAERKRCHSLCNRERFGLESADGSKRHLQWGGCGLRSRRMRSYAHRALGRLGAIGVMVRGKAQR